MSVHESAARVLQLIKTGEYFVDGKSVRFANEQAEAENTTRLYTPEECESISYSSEPMPEIRVVDGTTQEIAMKLVNLAQGKVCLLNFASARNPGGGFLNGAKAQEEDLCRCSGLYPCLLTCPQYYEANRQQPSLLYTDYAIFSSNVPFFKINGSGDLLPSPFLVSVITAPAPNSAPFLQNHPDGTFQIEETFLRRWRYILRIARDQGISRLLLGAWGCGAFGGDPVVASRTAKQAIQSDGGGIEEVVFAIPSSSRTSKTNLEAFQETFGSI